MWVRTVCATAIAAMLATGPAAAAPPGPIVPDTGKIGGFTYGQEASNSYSGWLGTMPWVWTFSMEHVGYGPGAPVAGRPFYLHAHTAIVSPDAVGDVMVTIDEDAGGLPLRYAPSSGMPLLCYYVQFDPQQVVSQTPCRDSVTVESGQILVSRLEPLSPGFGFSVLVPVVTDAPTSGNAAMTAMWATPQVHLSVPNLLASVPITVGADPNPPVIPTPVLTTRPLPRRLRAYKKVKTLTPKVCSVKKHKVVVHKHGLCKLKGGSRIVRIRY